MSPQLTSGSEGSGSASGSSPTTETPCARRSSSADSAMAAASTMRLAGQARREPAQREQGGDAAEADGDRRRVRLRQLPEQVGEHREEVAFARLDAGDLRQLADGDGEPEAEQEAGRHRLGDEVDDGAARSAPAAASTPAADEGERGRQRREAHGVAVRERADRGGGERGRRGRGAHDQRARGAQERVAQERARRGDQPGLGRQARDLRVGDHLRRDDAPHHQPGDQVAPQPGAVVAAQPRRDDAHRARR